MNLSTMQSMMDLQMRSNAPDYVNNRTAWLNEVQRNVCKLEKWDFTEREESFVSWTQTSTLTNRYARLAVIRTSGAGAPMELLPIDAASSVLLPTSGAPTHCRYPAGNQVTLYPAPDAPYDIKVAGHIFLPDFSAPGEENELSIVAPFVLIFGTLIEAALHLGRDPSLWKVRFEGEVQLLRDNHSRRGRGGG